MLYRLFNYKDGIIALISGVVLSLATSCQLASGNESSYEGQRVLGISFVATDQLVTNDDISPIKEIGATWLSLMPYGFVREGEGVVLYNTEWQWRGERDEGIKETVAIARAGGMKLMMKPHVWFRHGEYTGDYIPPDSSKVEFDASFENFVLHYARLAEEVNAEMYCIGTEWHKYIDSDPEFWQQLISKIKTIYSGQLTYAANWDEYKTVPFWQELDFIGVNAYFPLSDKDYPSLDELQMGWQPWLNEMKLISESAGKPVLFTEYGYRSTVKNASKPWESYTKPAVSLENQTLAYQTLYNEFWPQSWFAGGFAWKWFHNHEQRGGEDHIGFTPQNKPAEVVIQEYYTNK